MEALLIILYGIAFATIIYYMVHLRPMDSLEKAVTADKALDKADETAWPFTYSFWSSWIGHNGSPSTESVTEDYRIDVGKYGYTGRQDSKKFKQVFGNGYGFTGYGGNYGGGGSRYR